MSTIDVYDFLVMLIATQGKNIAATQQYFEEVLSRGDYYLGQEVNGRWHGQGAKILGLKEGALVTKDQFNQLLEGMHPVTGQRLTQRQRQDRRPGVDLTFSVPKSVSLAWAVLEDERVIEALRRAVHDTMRHDIEPLMHRRVRAGEHAATQQKSRTGKLIYADFLHKTSRPVDGLADPHLHIHAYVVNWTEQDGKHYAGELEEIVRQRQSLQAKFEARLARTLQYELGYSVAASRYFQGGKLKTGWELAGIDRPLIEKFSRRTAQVEQYAAEHGVQEPDEKGQLGKLTREKKDTGQTVEQLRQEWRSRLTEAERTLFANLRTSNDFNGQADELQAAREAIDYALEHHLYRQSTVERHQIIGTALEQGLTLRPTTIEHALDETNVIQRSMDVEGAERRLVTTGEVLEAERAMIAFARDGRGTRKSIGTPEYEISRDWLNEQQQAAVRSVLESRDTVMAISGGAGTGKTSLMQEAVEAVHQHSKRVFTFAPSTGAKEVLIENGFEDAQTVEHLLRNTQLQANIKDQVIWIDEAGLLDVRSMNGIFRIAHDQNARVVLSGDTRQHASPRRGEAMRLLETEAGLGIARVEAIQRQQGQYRQAVELISRGHEIVNERTGETGLIAGFDLLDALGKIQEIPREERYERLAERYCRDADKRSPLIVAPTHAEAAQVTAEIRSQLQRDGKLSTVERTLTQYRSLNLSEAEKGIPETYANQKGLIVQFHQNAKGGFCRGQRYRVVDADGDHAQLAEMNDTNAPLKQLPLVASDRFEVYTENQLQIAAGDKIRFTLGGTALGIKQQRISNGRLDEVKGFDKTGNLILKNGSVVDKEYAHIDLGYVITSHASQGKDRDVSIGAMGSESLPAINAKQFYVTVSRGRHDVLIYVDDKKKVRRAIERSGEQLSATAMLRSTKSEKAQIEEPHDTISLAEQGRRKLATFRNRVVQWWRRQHPPQTIGRPPQVRPPSNWGTGMSPSMGRSR